jgi:hypothetical protein
MTLECRNGEQAVGRVEMSAAGRMAGLHRFARLLALLAIVIYQPLAALHFATDEAHLSNAEISIQVAQHARHAHDHDGQPHRAQSQPHHPDHQLCGFCVMARVSLLSSGASTALGWATDTLASNFPVQKIRAPKRLRFGHPVRAPPRTV